MSKGIDQKFVHYGIRKDDLAMIEGICDAKGRWHSPSAWAANTRKST